MKNDYVPLFIVSCLASVIGEDLHDLYRLHFFLKDRSKDMYFTDNLNKYGCCCGQKGAGRPVDELDRCCYQHRKCLTSVLNNGCPVSSKYYTFSACFKAIFSCVDKDRCKYTFCSCDLQVVECLIRFQSNYNSELTKGNKTSFCLQDNTHI